MTKKLSLLSLALFARPVFDHEGRNGHGSRRAIARYSVVKDPRQSGPAAGPLSREGEDTCGLGGCQAFSFHARQGAVHPFPPFRAFSLRGGGRHPGLSGLCRVAAMNVYARFLGVNPGRRFSCISLTTTFPADPVTISDCRHRPDRLFSSATCHACSRGKFRGPGCG